jgi:large subunit ribosomal protein L10
MLTRVDKEAIVEGIKKKILSSKALFLTNVVGIPANDANALRKKIRSANGGLLVARNTLFKRAAQGTKAEPLFSNLKGNKAVAFAFEDAAGVAKALYEAGKENELIILESGLLENQILSKADVATLAKLPSRLEMLGTLLATFNAPVSAFARVLEAIRSQKEASGTN